MENQKSPLSFIDKANQVYIGKDTVYRAIEKDSINSFKELMNSGLLDELIKRNLILNTKLSSLIFSGYEMVLESKKITPVIYPYEWSPEMLRKAAICVLDVNECANSYGYELKDAHPYNVIFEYSIPKYIDLGSFIKKRNPNIWIAETEFLDCYYSHLKLVEKKLPRIFKGAYLTIGTGIPSNEIKTVTSLLNFILGSSITKKIISSYNFYKRASDYKNTKTEVSKIKKIILLISKIHEYKTNPKKIRKKIESFNLKSKSIWGDYHQKYNLYDNKGNIKLTQRMDSIIEIIKNLEVSTVLELAGNQGVLSRSISNIPTIERIICSDYEDNAIDRMILSQSSNDRVFPACFDFMHDFHEAISGEREKRLSSDLVIALAVTHHLTLTQGYSLDGVFSKISKYTKKHLLIEFMPLGLWDGKYSPPIPEWYNEKWFISSMENNFHIVKRIQLEENRILFVGQLKKQSET